MPPEFCLFLDENHCNNRHLLTVLRAEGVRHERHAGHFAPGTPDTEWLPTVGQRGWALLTSDGRIRYHTLEKQAVERHEIAMFYFSRNNMGGADMGAALAAALPAMQRMFAQQRRPFIASITREGRISLRETFGAAPPTLP